MKKDYAVEVEWRAFELRPDTPPEGAPLPEQYRGQEELSGHVKELADEAGLVMRRPQMIAYSRPSMEAAEFAKEQGKFDEYHHAMFKVYWEDTRDIGKEDVLLEAAGSIGLDPDELAEALEEGRYAEVITEQIEEARQLGITGIPAFIIDRYLVMGAQPYDIFQKVMAKVQEDRAE